MMIDSLARVANRILYKRFYDFRFKEIYQLEQLDHALQNMGLVDKPDIVYFANLSDIWNYAEDFKRGSGIRYEGRLIPMLIYLYSNSEYVKEGTTYQTYVNKYNAMNYGLFGFFSFNRMRPVNYAWQSDLMIDLTFGASATKNENHVNENLNYDSYNSYLKAMLNASWQFGYFPNTRTYLGLTPYTAISFVSTTDISNNSFGLNTGFVFDAYYYVSPRLRLSFFARFYYADKFDRTIPSPFWNNVTYLEIDEGAIQSTNDVTTSPINVYDAEAKISYSFSFALRYAIF